MTRNESKAEDDSAERSALLVARNLRRYREARNISLSSLASSSGVARATLYQMEAASANPTLETLENIAKVLGVTVSDLTSGLGPDAVRIVRADEGMLVARPGFTARMLRRFSTTTGALELYDLEVEPGDEVAAPAHPASVYEHVLVTKGRLRTGPADHVAQLGRGDYICFRGDSPHVYQAIGSVAQATLIMEYPSDMVWSSFSASFAAETRPASAEGPQRRRG